MTGTLSRTVDWLLRRLARFGGNQVCDLRCPLSLKLLNRCLQHAISIGDTLMLAQMFKPRFHQEGLHHPAIVGGILEHAPRVGAVASPLMGELFQRCEEWFPVLWVDPVFD